MTTRLSIRRRASAMTMRAGAAFLVTAAVLAPARALAACPAPAADGAIVLLRHANAPGVGDPPDMQLGDCATQRNLDADGREQSRRIGAALRARGADVTAVWTSQWCRARETAALAFPSLTARDVTAFNSFFQQRERAGAETRAAIALLGQWRGPGMLAVVTHQVNITELTGVVPASGEGVVVCVREGRVRTSERIAAPALR